MTIIEINAVNYGSTGSIMLQIADFARNDGFKVYSCCAMSRSNLKKRVDNQILIGNIVSRNIHILVSKYTGYEGYCSFFSTLNFIRRIDSLKPSLIHLHNLHGSYVNLPLLFWYIKRRGIPVVWTLHDCWPFTGKCPHFIRINCCKWKTGCHDCEQMSSYPVMRVDRSAQLWKSKKCWFSGIEHMRLVTPSKWLGNQIADSILKEYPVAVINNGIDLGVFKPTPSCFRRRHHLSDSVKIVLGVAHRWDERKGLDVLVELASRLDERFRVVLVGTDNETDRLLPDCIISVHKTTSQTELVEIYTAADVFVNPTREDNYPTVNMEAIACGTPVITFRTGGSPEIPDENSGSVVDNIDEMEREIIRVCTKEAFSMEDCLHRAKAFDKNERASEYVDLFLSVLSEEE